MKSVPLLRAVVTIGVLTVAAHSTAMAQNSRPFIAPFGGYNVDGSEALVGAAIGLPVRMGAVQLVFAPGFEYYPFMDVGSFYTFTFDVHYAVPVPQAPVQPYIGGGVIVNRASVDVLGQSVSATNSQVNAVGGMGFGASIFQPFVEANLRFVDGSTFLLKAGGRIGLGK